MLRKTAHAGSFYPRFGDQISTWVRRWIEDKPVAPASEKAVELIVPHAGYIYSGACAANAFHYISEQDFDTFVILHPSHHGMHFDWSVSPFDQYDSPLGKLEQDTQLYELLTRNGDGAGQELRLHEAEHSMEIQLPLIKFFFPDARVCPIMIGQPYPEVATRLAKKLREAIASSGKKVCIVVSTDLSHYYDSDRAERMDSLIIRYIMSLDPDALWQSVISKRCEACGIGGILTLLNYARPYPEIKARLIEYTHSGKVTGDNQQVVGYLSAILYR
jgi:AmmeMemoRadiSam system protein B